MKTPWEKYIEDIENTPDAEFIAWQRWIVENDTDDVTEYIDLMAEIFFYGMFLKAIDRQIVKGRYINDPYDGLEAFECSECGAALAIVDDAVKEQPNFCFNCGAKFDWRGVYEAIEEGNPDNWILLCNAGQQIKDGEE